MSARFRMSVTFEFETRPPLLWRGEVEGTEAAASARALRAARRALRPVGVRSFVVLGEPVRVRASRRSLVGAGAGRLDAAGGDEGPAPVGEGGSAEKISGEASSVRSGASAGVAARLANLNHGGDRTSQKQDANLPLGISVADAASEGEP